MCSLCGQELSNSNSKIEALGDKVHFQVSTAGRLFRQELKKETNVHCEGKGAQCSPCKQHTLSKKEGTQLRNLPDTKTDKEQNQIF